MTFVDFSAEGGGSKASEHPVHRIIRLAAHGNISITISMQRAKIMLERNQYPPTFYEPIINQTLNGL